MHLIDIRMLWDNELMVQAMEAAKTGRMGVNRAAKEYDMVCQGLV